MEVRDCSRARVDPFAVLFPMARHNSLSLRSPHPPFPFFGFPEFFHEPCITTVSGKSHSLLEERRITAVRTSPLTSQTFFLT